MAIIEASVEATYDRMAAKLSDVVPAIEMRYKAELVFEINAWKKKRDAVILGHNYMEPALFHAVADVTGDSLELCRKAALMEKPVIVFCGVKFMAETAKILNPSRTVLLPSMEAGCSLAGSLTGDDVRRLKAKFPGVPVVTYVNCYADVKAESDICCTSGNAAKIIASLASDSVIFLPDEYLARNVARETGKRIIFPLTEKGATRFALEEGDGEDTVIGWHGRCEVHEQFTVADIENVRAQYPDVHVLAHPECPPDVLQAADFSGSTSQMVKHVKTSGAPRYLILTECSMADNVIAENPDKDILRLCSVRCPHMARITLEDTLAALKNMQHVIDLPPAVIAKARRAVDRMLEVG